MNRGAVIIGVDKYPRSQLPQLQAATRGANSMARWARSNGFEVKLITDVKRPVTLKAVVAAVSDFVERGGVDTLDQLLVYFAGHGINKGFSSEYWLLSEAPYETTEAINLRSSIDIARYTTGIRNVVFVSDACRTAADTIEAQEVEGGSAFPNIPRTLGGTAVDRLYAALPGHPAQEVKSVQDSAGAYRAIYTDCLLDAVKGKYHQIIETVEEAGESLAVVTATGLDDFLTAELSARVAKLRLTLAQVPDAQVESKLPTYLARVLKPSKAKTTKPPPVEATLARTALQQTNEAMSGHIVVLNVQEQQSPTQTLASELSQDAAIVRSAIGRDRFETHCGFTIVGIDVRSAHAFGHHVEIIREGEPQQVHVRVWNPQYGRPTQAVSVLLEFENGSGCVLAALPDYVGTLVFDRNELANVSYEPLEDSPRWADFSQAAEQLRLLRGAVAASSRHGVFRIGAETAGLVGDRIRYMKSIDPTLGLYAAYAYSEAGLLRDVQSVEGHMRGDLNSVLFDVGMLSRQLSSNPVTLLAPEFVPFCPMLSQGWSILPAKSIVLPEAVQEAGRYLMPSLWTLFKPRGVEVLSSGIRSGALL